MSQTPPDFPSESIRWMNIKEFRDFGVLQELNRCFLHPLGLALSISVDDTGEWKLYGIWDYRIDPEGIVFAEVDIKSEDFQRRAKSIALLRESKFETRARLFGGLTNIQPLRSHYTENDK